MTLFGQHAPGLSAALHGVTGRWGLPLSHAQNAVRWLASSKKSVKALRRHLSTAAFRSKIVAIAMVIQSSFKVHSFMTRTHKGMANMHVQIQHKTHIKVVRRAR